VFSFALTGQSRTQFLLIIPLSSYMQCSRFIEDRVGIRQIGRYASESLSARFALLMIAHQWRDSAGMPEDLKALVDEALPR
jgi:hypothetical protein